MGSRESLIINGIQQTKPSTQEPCLSIMILSKVTKLNPEKLPEEIVRDYAVTFWILGLHRD